MASPDESEIAPYRALLPPKTPRAAPSGSKETCAARCQDCGSALGFVFWGIVIVYDDLWCKGRKGLDWQARLRRNIAEPTEAVARQVAVVTGSNGGVGYPTALNLARAGLHVILACRSPVRGLEAQTSMNAVLEAEGAVGRAEYRHCDVSDLASVERFAKELGPALHGRRLALVVCNAGIMASPYAQATLAASTLDPPTA